MLNTPSSSESVTHNMADNAPKQVLPFCFVRILPEYHAMRTINAAIRLFEENDHLQLHIYDKITEKTVPSKINVEVLVKARII